MRNSENLKNIVVQKYSEIATQSKEENETSCCGVNGCATVDYAVFADDYSKTKGYSADADLGLGCGIPTEFAQIKPGDTVLDLGSGAGNDCFVARELTGESGKVIGVDMTDVMIRKARENADKLNFNNVEFRHGDIEDLPIGDATVDVVISNCVLNLVPDKVRAFHEMARVLRPGGHFSVSDVVLKGDLPEALRNDAEMYAGCVSGAIQLDEYLQLLREAGFDEVKVQKEKAVNLPDEILDKYLDSGDKTAYRAGTSGVFSVTVYGQIPACVPGGGCC
ncbi:arsenite methyltransferase [Membranicola marinus]|uniref:Arsenite methyltransferase n=1 Tax=Membranihabitans marinus TaxID=1227546 RepID=A0A953L8M0_9BACT|nr:arsenite methyltransferase [Membranihabitans marinus]MBY5959967.1 arsenite methyltransferase [Membranihabitans marinus]